MNKPFVSIIIPTRNRGSLASACIRAAANQTFDNYEVIVSENSTNLSDRALVSDIVATLAGDCSLRMIQPEEPLNMADHWEFATRHANGQYVAVIPDRHAIRPSAVQVWNEVIEPRNSELLIWNVRSGYSQASGLERTENFDPRIFERETSCVLNEFLQFDRWNESSMYMNTIPRGLNSLFRSDVADKIRTKHGRLYHPLSPDYTSAYLLLANAQQATYSNRPFYCTFGDQSNGEKTVAYGTGTYASTYPGVNQYEGCPIDLDTVFNTLLRDFLAMQRIENNLESSSFCMVGYLLSNYREVVQKEILGSPLDTMQMKRKWTTFVNELPEDQRREVYTALETMNGKDVRFRGLRRFLLRTNLLRFVKSGKEVLRKYLRSGGKQKYASVTEVIQATDHYLHT